MASLVTSSSQLSNRMPFSVNDALDQFDDRTINHSASSLSSRTLNSTAQWTKSPTFCWIREEQNNKRSVHDPDASLPLPWSDTFMSSLSTTTQREDGYDTSRRSSCIDEVCVSKSTSAPKTPSHNSFFMPSNEISHLASLNSFPSPMLNRENYSHHRAPVPVDVKNSALPLVPMYPQSDWFSAQNAQRSELSTLSSMHPLRNTTTTDPNASLSAYSSHKHEQADTWNANETSEVRSFSTSSAHIQHKATPSLRSVTNVSPFPAGDSASTTATENDESVSQHHISMQQNDVLPYFCTPRLKSLNSPRSALCDDITHKAHTNTNFSTIPNPSASFLFSSHNRNMSNVIDQQQIFSPFYPNQVKEDSVNSALLSKLSPLVPNDILRSDVPMQNHLFNVEPEDGYQCFLNSSMTFSGNPSAPHIPSPLHRERLLHETHGTGVQDRIDPAAYSYFELNDTSADLMPSHKLNYPSSLRAPSLGSASTGQSPQFIRGGEDDGQSNTSDRNMWSNKASLQDTDSSLLPSATAGCASHWLNSSMPSSEKATSHWALASLPAPDARQCTESLAPIFLSRSLLQKALASSTLERFDSSVAHTAPHNVTDATSLSQKAELCADDFTKNMMQFLLESESLPPNDASALTFLSNSTTLLSNVESPLAPPSQHQQQQQLHIPRVLRELILHACCQCKPCAFFYNKKKGCRNGDQCDFCHHEDHAKCALKQWKKHQQRCLKQWRRSSLFPHST